MNASPFVISTCRSRAGAGCPPRCLLRRRRRAAAAATARSRQRQRPGSRRRRPRAPAAPKLALTSPAGILLVQIKPDQTAVFEEIATKLKAGFARPRTRTEAAGRRLQDVQVRRAVWSRTRSMSLSSTPPCRTPSTSSSRCSQKTMTPERFAQRPRTAEMWKRFAAAHSHRAHSRLSPRRPSDSA